MTSDNGYTNNSSNKKRKRRDSSHSLGSKTIETSFASFQMDTLRRYKRHFKLQNRPGMNKAQLVDSVSKHFKAIAVREIEKEILSYFMYMVKMNKNRIDIEARENDNGN